MLPHEPDHTIEQVGPPAIEPNATEPSDDSLRSSGATNGLEGSASLPVPDAPFPDVRGNSVVAPEGTIVQSPQEAGQAADLSHGRTTSRSLPTILGYEILGELGRGGTGVVYRARHIRLNRPTAIKMLIGGQYADPVAQVRFLVEAEVVALIQHPNVVQVFEFGQHDGQPFFALEFVDGGTLAEKLHNSTRFSARDAARMVAKLADAVAAAHAKGIVHRDLKPANVLLDAQGEPKVTDFGLAKVGQSEMTATGAIMGTPSYMSPEQAAGRTKEVGTPTDVYALGVILYELLSGRPPFKGDSVMETIHQVLTSDPVWPRTLHSSIPRDLETICLKCMEKDPRKRYGTAEALATDLRAYLDGRPISARPLGTFEVAIKLARRRPTLAALLLVSVLGVAGIVWKYIEAEQQRDIAEEKSRDAEIQKGIAEEKQRDAEQQRAIAEERRKDAERQKSIAEERRQEAEQQRETALAVSEFLGGLFEDADPLALTGRMFGVQKRREGDLTALEVVDRAAVKLKTALTDKPRIRAALLDRIGNVYLDLGRAREAEPLLQEAMQLRRKRLGDDHIEMAASWQSLGQLHLSVGDLEQAGKEFEQALALRRKHLGNNHQLVADTLFYLGTQRAFHSEVPQAERLLNECLAIRRHPAGKESREIAVVLLMLGQMYLQNDEPLKALPLLSEAAAMLDKLGGKNDFSGIVSLFIKAQFSARLGNPKQAKALYQEVDLKATRLLGPDHYIVIFGRGMYAGFLFESGEPEESLKVLRGVVASYRKTFGPDSKPLADKLLTLARAERNLNHLAEAETAARESVSILRRNAQTPKLALQRSECLHVLGALVYNRGDADEASVFYREALAIRLRLGEESRTFELARDLSRMLFQKAAVTIASPAFLTHSKATGDAKVDFGLAQAWAQAAQALTRLSPKPTADDELVLQFLQGQAVSMLRSSVASGMRDVKAIQMFADFKPLHDRADYQEVLRGLTPPAPE
ncbi:MAG: hypothetical protein C0467_06925 [Planctomycetaceae bacterium]|nr:hypothetical protein [Planctomycetaceae bacterium]